MFLTQEEIASANNLSSTVVWMVRRWTIVSVVFRLPTSTQQPGTGHVIGGHMIVIFGFVHLDQAFPNFLIFYPCFRKGKNLLSASLENFKWTNKKCPLHPLRPEGSNYPPGLFQCPPSLEGWYHPIWETVISPVKTILCR